ncbi:MAG: hypothetical protein WAV28_19590, partial [Sedimentisphaerales bacterium]
QRFLFDKHHRLEHQLAVRDGCWAVNSEHLYASEGIPFAGNMDIYIANMLAGCDGQRTLRELVAMVASRMKTDPETITPACLTAFLRLMRSGFLSSVSGSDKST